MEKQKEKEERGKNKGREGVEREKKGRRECTKQGRLGEMAT